jgi:hypothetical protein
LACSCVACVMAQDRRDGRTGITFRASGLELSRQTRNSKGRT